MKYKNNNKGFTIIELLVAVAIFSVVILGSVDIFIKSIESQKESFVESEVGNNARYAMEAIAKEIRMADGVTTINGAYNALTITNSKLENITYSLVVAANGNQQINRNVAGTDARITSDKIDVTDLTFFVNDWDLSAGPQPRITISMTAKAPATSSSDAEINLQTTLSLRIY